MRTLLLNPYSHAKVKTTNYPSPSLLQLLLHIPSKSLQNQIHKPTTTSSSFFYICLKEVYGGGIRRLEAERAGRRTLLRRRVGGPHRLGDRRGSRHLRSLLGSWSVAFRTRCFGVVLLLAAIATMIGVWGLRMVFFSVLRHVTTFLARRLPCRVSLLGVTR